MSQGALSVASGSGATVRAALNAALARLATQASGTARPSDIAAGETWIETDNPGTGVWSWWLYDGASDILLATINSTSHVVTPVAPTQSPGDNSTKVATTAFVTAALAALSTSLPRYTASLGANVALNNTSAYFDGPSVAQGSSGTWFASGTVTLGGGLAGEVYDVKLWDGTTVIASGRTYGTTSGLGVTTLALSGFIASPAGNIRMSVRDSTSTSGQIYYNQSGNQKDSTLTVLRVA